MRFAIWPLLLLVASCSPVAAQDTDLAATVPEIGFLSPGGDPKIIELVITITIPNSLLWPAIQAERGEFIPVAVALECGPGIAMEGPSTLLAPVPLASTGTNSKTEARGDYRVSALPSARGLLPTTCTMEFAVDSSTTMGGTSIKTFLKATAMYTNDGCSAGEPTFGWDDGTSVALVPISCAANADTSFSVLPDAASASARTPKLREGRYAIESSDLDGIVTFDVTGLQGQALTMRLKPYAEADASKTGPPFEVFLMIPGGDAQRLPSPVAPALLAVLLAGVLQMRRRTPA